MKIVEYFSGKNIFITGGSGFLGKVLIEKLLRSCEGIGNIYVLIRAKKGKSIEERLEHIKSFILFDKVREKDPELLKKLIPINGDVMELKLGISQEDRQLIINNVHIIFHAAASVRFDDPLQYAIIANVRGTRELVNLATELKHLSVLVHVSTAYCNCDKLEVDEILYPAPADWRKAIQMAEEMDEVLINSFSEKYIRPLPNTYTFAKALGEHVVTDMCEGNLPAIIVRPTIVISAFKEPFCGWIDNLNGPMGLTVAAGKGILRTALGNKQVNQDIIPVDIVANMLLVTTKYRGLNRNIEEVGVYHASKGKYSPMTLEEFADFGIKSITHSPFSETLWYPKLKLTKCWYNYYIQVLLFHMLPAFFFDLLLKIIGRKPMLFTIQRKVYIANNVIEFFISRTWTFKHTKVMRLIDELTDDEKTIFGMDDRFKFMELDVIMEYLEKSRICTGNVVLKEDYDSTRTASVRKLQSLWILDVAAKIIFLSLLMWFFFVRKDMLRVTYSSVENYFTNL